VILLVLLLLSVVVVAAVVVVGVVGVVVVVVSTNIFGIYLYPDLSSFTTIFVGQFPLYH
jgi:hypothetical protein